MKVTIQDDYYSTEALAKSKASGDYTITQTDDGYYRLTIYKELPQLIDRNDYDITERFTDTDTITVQLDSEGFTKKPSGFDMGQISKRLKDNDMTKDISIEQLAMAINSGFTACYGIPSTVGSLKEDNLHYQQIFGIDIDNDSGYYTEENNKVVMTDKKRREDFLDLDGIWDRCNDYSISPLIIYETFSHKSDFPRYRVLFATYEPQGSNVAKQIRQALSIIFPEADKQCRDGMRRFYGGHVVYSGTFSIVADYVKEYAKADAVDVPKEATTITSQSNSKSEFRCVFNFNGGSNGASQTCTSGYDIRAEISKFDLPMYMLQKYGYSRLNDRCPLCSHEHGCFRLYPNNTWACFGAASNPGPNHKAVGGNIINFLMLKEGLTKSQAVDKFLYDILKKERFTIKF